jgi:hypothetical protein
LNDGAGGDVLLPTRRPASSTDYNILNL